MRSIITRLCLCLVGLVSLVGCPGQESKRPPKSTNAKLHRGRPSAIVASLLEVSRASGTKLNRDVNCVFQQVLWSSSSRVRVSLQSLGYSPSLIEDVITTQRRYARSVCTGGETHAAGQAYSEAIERAEAFATTFSLPMPASRQHAFSLVTALMIQEASHTLKLCLSSAEATKIYDRTGTPKWWPGVLAAGTSCEGVNSNFGDTGSSTVAGSSPPLGPDLKACLEPLLDAFSAPPCGGSPLVSNSASEHDVLIEQLLPEPMRIIAQVRRMLSPAIRARLEAAEKLGIAASIVVKVGVKAKTPMSGMVPGEVYADFLVELKIPYKLVLADGEPPGASASEVPAPAVVEEEEPEEEEASSCLYTDCVAGMYCDEEGCAIHYEDGSIEVDCYEGEGCTTEFPLEDSAGLCPQFQGVLVTAPNPQAPSGALITAYDAFTSCLCRARGLNSVSGSLYDCPSTEMERRLECLSNPYGPDDGPRVECLEFLREAAELDSVAPCLTLQCAPHETRLAHPQDSCSCSPTNKLFERLNRLNCSQATCPPEAPCQGGVCIPVIQPGASCSGPLCVAN